MNPVLYTKNLLAIVYDADRIPEPDARILDTGYWLQNGAVKQVAPGRGATLLIDTSFGPAVLRRYLRGGLPAKLSRGNYFYTGVERSRPFREFEILRRMSEHGLPVPAPLAASCERSWMTYRGGLLMEQLEGGRTLAELVVNGDMRSEVWFNAGKCINTFHSSGVEHADLNARNILVKDPSLKVSLLDFDQCTFEPGRQVNGKQNLARLKRSLEKFWPQQSKSTMDKCWQNLMAGYNE